MDKTAQFILISILLTYSIFWCAVIFMAIPKEERKKKQKKYDERQIYEQSRACKYSYITLIIYLLFYGLWETGFDITWCEPMFGLCLGIGFSLSVFLAYCVFQDAYLAISETNTAVLISPNIIALTQLSMGITCISEGSIIENGVITDNALHFLIVGLVLFFDLLLFIRKRMNQRPV